MSPTAKPVLRRKVFYIPGYDPFPPRRYRELYRTESARQAEISGYGLTLKGTPRGKTYGWRTSALIDDIRTTTDFEVLVWADLVRDSMATTVAGTYWHLIRTYWTYFASGTMRRLAMLPKGPLVAALYPLAMLPLQLVLALLAAHLVGLALATVCHAAMLWIGWGGAVARFVTAALYWGPFLVITLYILRWFKTHDRRFYAQYLLHDYAFSASRRGAIPPQLQNRLDAFRATIGAALAEDDLDEVLVIGHSSGVHLAILTLADLLRDTGDRPTRPALSLLSLGQVVPMVSFLPKAHKLRADLQFLSECDDIVWVDVTAPGDGCSYALCDPVGVSGVATEDKQWPLVFSAQFSQSLSPEQWRALRYRFFRLHFQYMCAFDRPLDYDYFQITAGPMTLGQRYAHRPPSKSRIDVPVSKYTNVTP